MELVRTGYYAVEIELQVETGIEETRHVFGSLQVATHPK
jgi:hypothetical protein